MSAPKFTPTEVARGLATTIARGDWSLAAWRLRAVSVTRRESVLRHLREELSAEDWQTWTRYWGRIQ